MRRTGISALFSTGNRFTPHGPAAINRKIAPPATMCSSFHAGKGKTYFGSRSEQVPRGGNFSGEPRLRHRNRSDSTDRTDTGKLTSTTFSSGRKAHWTSPVCWILRRGNTAASSSVLPGGSALKKIRHHSGCSATRRASPHSTGDRMCRIGNSRKTPAGWPKRPGRRGTTAFDFTDSTNG